MTISIKKANASYFPLIIIAVCFSTVVVIPSFAANATPVDQEKTILHNSHKLQVPFVANNGQITDCNVKYYAKSFVGSTYIMNDGELVYALWAPNKGISSGDLLTDKKNQLWILKETLVDSLQATPLGIDKSSTKVSFFKGIAKENWRANVPAFNLVTLGEVYPGIELRLRAHGNNVEKIFTVQPGANPAKIRLALQGTKSVRISEEGELEMKTDFGVVRFTKPKAFQETDGGEQEIHVAYNVHEDTYGFELGAYDNERPLIIDPEISYSTYLGGQGGIGAGDIGRGIAVDDMGNAYVTGATFSDDVIGSGGIATPGAYQAQNAGLSDVFVAKFNPDGTNLVYSTYIGGSLQDFGIGIVVDGSGNAYITGSTAGPSGLTSFPTTPDAFQPTHAGPARDAFIVKLNPTGNQLLYSSFLGGMISMKDRISR